MQTVYGIVGTTNCTVTMTTTNKEMPAVTNSEGAVVIGSVMERHRKRLVADGATEAKIFPIGGAA